MRKAMGVDVFIVIKDVNEIDALSKNVIVSGAFLAKKTLSVTRYY
jgi:hypothetical protein